MPRNKFIEIENKLGGKLTYSTALTIPPVPDFRGEFVPTAFQWSIINCNADLVGLTGAAGTGKTMAALYKALAYVDFSDSEPSYNIKGEGFKLFDNVLICRETYPMLEGIIRSLYELCPDGHHSPPSKRFLLPHGDGAYIAFEGINRPTSVRKKKGISYAYIFIDEANQLKKSTVFTILGWQRSVLTDTQGVLSFNAPMSPDEAWVVEDTFAPWINPDSRYLESGETLFYYNIDGKEYQTKSSKSFEHDGKLIVPSSRTCFIGMPDVNQHLASTGYYDRLKNYPEELREQLVNFNMESYRGAGILNFINWKDFREFRHDDDAKCIGIGIDPARLGSNNLVITPLYQNTDGSLCIPYQEVVPGVDVENGAAVLAVLKSCLLKWEIAYDVPIAVDIIGLGSSAYDSIEADGYETEGFNGTYRAEKWEIKGEFPFANLKSQILWEVRLMVKSGRLTISPRLDKLKYNLISWRWRLVSYRGKKAIEVINKKSDVKSLGNVSWDSPDWGDSACLAVRASNEEVEDT